MPEGKRLLIQRLRRNVVPHRLVHGGKIAERPLKILVCLSPNCGPHDVQGLLIALFGRAIPAKRAIQPCQIVEAVTKSGLASPGVWRRMSSACSSNGQRRVVPDRFVEEVQRLSSAVANSGCASPGIGEPDYAPGGRSPGPAYSGLAGRAARPADADG